MKVVANPAISRETLKRSARLRRPDGTGANQPLTVVTENANGPWTKHLRHLNGLLPTIGIDLAIQAFTLAKSGAFTALHTL